MTKAKSKQRKAKGKEDEEKSSGVEEQLSTLLCALPSGEGILSTNFYYSGRPHCITLWCCCR